MAAGDGRAGTDPDFREPFRGLAGDHYRLKAATMLLAVAAWPSCGRPSRVSVVPNSDQWLNSVPDLEPALVVGLMTSVAMWHPMSVVLEAQLLLVPPSPSSHVMKTARLPDWYSGLARITGRFLDNHVSPC